MISSRLFKFSLGLVILLFIPASPVLAHVLKTSGSIGVILHIDPDDDPIAGQAARFYFEFQDQQNKFQPGLCNCQVTITEGGQAIFTQTLPKGISNDSMSQVGGGDFSFTFPKRDVYQLTLGGQPTSPNAFRPFTIQYDIRVDRTSIALSSDPGSVTDTKKASDQLPTSIYLYILAGAVVLLAFGGTIWWKSRHFRTAP